MPGAFLEVEANQDHFIMPKLTDKSDGTQIFEPAPLLDAFGALQIKKHKQKFG